MKKFCLGFAFDAAGKHVLLIRKNRPTWQRGSLNGVGGHVERNESFHAAMAREFREETGVETYESNWKHFATLSGPEFLMHVFSIHTNEIHYAESKTDEIVVLHNVADLHRLHVISNLTWLIPAALDQHFMQNNYTLEARYEQ
jgi:8-oxo-dGTP diphosphatase